MVFRLVGPLIWKSWHSHDRAMAVNRYLSPWLRFWREDHLSHEEGSFRWWWWWWRRRRRRGRRRRRRRGRRTRTTPHPAIQQWHLRMSLEIIGITKVYSPPVATASSRDFSPRGRRSPLRLVTRGAARLRLGRATRWGMRWKDCCGLGIQWASATGFYYHMKSTTISSMPD